MKALLGLIIAAMAGASGCTSAETADALPVRVGDRVNVQFRRDALGTAASLPVSPTTDSLNGGTCSLSGVIEDVRPGWLRLDVRSSTGMVNGVPVHNYYWVPATSILLIEAYKQ